MAMDGWMDGWHNTFMISKGLDNVQKCSQIQRSVTDNNEIVARCMR